MLAGEGLQRTWGALRGAVAPSGHWDLSPGAGPGFTGCCSSPCLQAPRCDCCISVAGALKPVKPLVHKAESPKSSPPKLGAVSHRLPGSPQEFSELFGDEAAVRVLSLSKTMLQVKLSCVVALVVLLVFFWRLISIIFVFLCLAVRHYDMCLCACSWSTNMMCVLESLENTHLQVRIWNKGKKMMCFAYLRKQIIWGICVLSKKPNQVWECRQTVAFSINVSLENGSQKAVRATLCTEHGTCC